MLEKLIDFVVSISGHISPISIVNQWEKGIILRFGVFNRYAEPGLRFKIPMIESIISIDAATTTLQSMTQTLTTRCGRSVIVGSIIRYHITDIKPYLIDTIDAEDVIRDTLQGAVKTIVSSTHLDKLNLEGTEKKVLRLVRRQLEVFGIAAELVTFSDLGRIKSIRLINE